METFTMPGKEITNAVEEFIFGIFGGVDECARRTDIDRTTLYDALRLGRVRSRQMAMKWRDLAKGFGHPIPAGELLKLEDQPWDGPERLRRRVSNGFREGMIPPSSRSWTRNAPTAPAALHGARAAA